MTGNDTLMAGYGVDLLSDKIRFKPNTRYRCTGMIKSAGPAMKVFVKGYATVTRSVDSEPKTFEDQVYQMRKDLKPTEDWTAFTLDLEIIPTNVFSDHKHRIDYLRIKLWAYWPAGTCWFDDIRLVEDVSPAPTSRRADAPVTHVGVPPRLQETTYPPADPAEAWLDSVNAFNAADHAKSWALLRPLLESQPDNCDYRVLAARNLVSLGFLAAADAHASWLLERAASEDPAARPLAWQVEWARFVRAQVLCKTGDTSIGISLLMSLAQSSSSPHVRQAARKYLSEVAPSNKTP